MDLWIFPWLVTTRKVSKYGVFSGPYFTIFSPKTGKYEPEKTPYLDTFHTVGVGSIPVTWDDTVTQNNRENFH